MLFLNTKNAFFLDTIKRIVFKYEERSILNMKNVLCSNTKNAPIQIRNLCCFQIRKVLYI